MKYFKILAFFFIFFCQFQLVPSQLTLMADEDVFQKPEGEQEKNSKIEYIINRARVYRNEKKYEESEKLINEALKNFTGKEDQKKLQIERANVHFWWSVSIKKKYDYIRAIKHLEIAYAIDIIYRPRFSAIELYAIGKMHSDLGRKQKALEYYEKALPIFKAVGDRYGEGSVLNNSGAVYDDLGQKDKALEYYEKALPIQQAVGNRSGEATTLNNIGAMYDDLGQKEKALAHYEKALLIRKAMGDRSGEATVLSNIGLVYSDLGQKYKALRYYEKALPISREVGDRAGEATTLNNIGAVYSDLGQKNKALGYYEKTLPIRRAVGDRSGVATALNNIGTVYSDLGQKYKALEYYEKALPIWKAVGDRSGVARTLSNIGGVYSGLGQKYKALEYYEKALPIQRAVGDHSGVALTFNKIGLLYSDLGQKYKALEYYEKALPIRRAVGDRAGEAMTLNNIGGMYSDLGQKNKALENYEKALPIWREVGDRAGVAATLNNIGLVYFALGQNPKALEYHENALPIRREVGDRTGEATTLNNIGLVYYALGKNPKALAYFEKALPISREVGDRAGEAASLNNIGGAYNLLGQKNKALEYHKKALPIRRAVGDRAGEAMTLNNIGGVYYGLGRSKEALKYYEKALPIFQVIRDRSNEAVTLNNMMFSWKRLKNTQFSIFYGKQSVNAFQKLRAYISELDRKFEKSYLGEKKHTYRYLASLLIDEERIPEAQNVLDMLKEKEYFEFTGKDQSATPTYSQLDFTEFENQWLDKYEKVTKDYSSISGDYYLLNKKKIKSETENKRLRVLEASLKQYRKDYEEYLTELKKSFDKYNNTVKKGTIKTPNSQKIFWERQTTLRQLDELEGGKHVFLHFMVQENRIAVIFTTADSQFERFCDVSKKKLKGLINKHRLIIRDMVKRWRGRAAGTSFVKAVYKDLYDLFFKPVDEKLRNYGATNLMIYLDGLLRYIPLPVLWDGETYLVQRYRITLFTSASFERIQREPGENNKILGLGASGGGKGFDPLLHVKEEIESIVKDNEKGFNGLINGSAFLDNDFTKETFVNQLKTAAYPLVHISSHFTFNTDGETGDETKSYLLMGDGSQMNLKEMREQKGLFNRVELLTLSACETGRGDADGREIDGFGELAQQSGAQCVVASLWKVRDKSTKDLMVNFYRLLKEGKITSKIEALRQAQLELAGLEDLLDKKNPMVKRERTKYSHPYYWGPFIMIGNWR